MEIVSVKMNKMVDNIVENGQNKGKILCPTAKRSLWYRLRRWRWQTEMKMSTRVEMDVVKLEFEFYPIEWSCSVH